MTTIQLTIENHLATITLDRGRSNPINHQMVIELTVCVKSLENDPQVGGLIITGKEGFFTSGVDLIEAYGYNEQQIRNFWTDFLKLQTVLTGFKKPMVAAISGHSPAGGCIIAICCDYRVMAEGEYIIGLNEVPVGIVVPDVVFDLYSMWIGQRKAYQSLLEGKLFKVNEAKEIGLIDEVSSSTELLAVAGNKIRAYMKLNPVTWTESKLNLRKALIKKMNVDQTEGIETMLKQWWAPETRQGLQMMIEKLTAKK
jgi:3,2-trans-enoyl-CoA isomerase